MANLLNFATDVKGANTFAPQPCSNLMGAVLITNISTPFTVPGNYQNWIVAFSYSPGASVWVNFTGVAAVIPSASSFSSVNVEFLPAARLVKAGDVINVITSTANAYVGVMLYAVS